MATYDAPALDKGLDILEFLSAQSTPQSQLEIATGIERKANEIYRMLISLEKRGYISKDPVSGKYSLTLRLFHLAHHHSSVDRMVKASELHMINLANCINQSVHLSVLYRNKLMIIAQAQSQTPVSLSVEIGSLFPLERTNSGKMILANLEEFRRRSILAECKDYLTFSKEEQKEFLAELDGIKTRQINSARSLLTEGITDFSAPILDMRGEVVAVLAVSTLTTQMRKLVSSQEIESALVSTVENIRRAMGLIE